MDTEYTKARNAAANEINAHLKDLNRVELSGIAAWARCANCFKAGADWGRAYVLKENEELAERLKFWRDRATKQSESPAVKAMRDALLKSIDADRQTEYNTYDQFQKLRDEALAAYDAERAKGAE